MKLDEEGFEVKIVLNKRKYLWTDIESFWKFNYRGNERINFNFTDEYNKKNEKKKSFKIFKFKYWFFFFKS